MGDEAIYRKEDSEYIQKRIITARKNELVARSFLPIDEDTPSYSLRYTVEHVEDTGSARIREAGSDSDGMPLIGEKAGTQGDALFVIEAGFKITRDDLEAAEARRQSGKGSEYPVSDKRLDGTRRFIAEQENGIIFNGLKLAGKIIKPGYFNWPGINEGQVADSASSQSGIKKRLWKYKTPNQILADIVDAKEELEGDGKYHAAGILIDDRDYMRLLMPVTENSTVTTLQWLLQNKDVFFPRGFIRTKNLSYDILGKTIGNDSVGGFCIFDDAADVAEMILARDLEVIEGDWDKFSGKMKVRAEQKTGGVHVHKPKGIVMRYGTNTVKTV
ncbi:major capsid family protein [Leptospira santarosai]|uniref:PF09950 family protein n=1 Tax=Leptospira santarosai serovar Arenal str. MAVJ 401 TaxID=1049976 RepID=M6JDV3_9LEPT|nr:major capsid family protein [Leptospira santarosai]EMM77079.1 PF09950 family protein [Leptospira santarosai str. 2000030832]EMN20139.1 PF09950 family protein [Leptospira santarosai serovar Arenal str. MAVJ 401]